MKRAQELSGDKEAVIPDFQWDLTKDFKDVPENWIPAKGVQIIDGAAYPDENGHIPGWVPIDPQSKQYCWHLTVVDLELGIGLVLQPDGADTCDDASLCIRAVPLADLLECTLELIGTNVNANPYNLGTKQRPVHLLTRHGIIGFKHTVPPLMFSELKRWFEEEIEGRVEGVVWHCGNGVLYKVHRHHLGLPWPITNPALASRPVKICMDAVKYENNFDPKSQFFHLGQRNTEVIENLRLI